MSKGWALITGASSGLGEEFARLAAAEGYDLLLAARSTGKLQTLASELSATHNINALPLSTDLARHGAGDALWEEASAGRTIAVLVNNAGLGANGVFGADAAREAETVSVNVVAYTELLQAAANDMRARGSGKILNVASAAGFMPGPGMAVYHASKAYALSLSEAVAHELNGTGVTVTALCPGATRTGFFDAAQVERTWLMTLLPMERAPNVAHAGWRAMQAGRRLRVTGWPNIATVQLMRLLPRRAVVTSLGLLLKRNR